MTGPTRLLAERNVDHALDYVGASETYRANNRDEMIRNHLTWAAFERRQREADACKAVARIAGTVRDLCKQASRHRAMGRVRRAA